MSDGAPRLLSEILEAGADRAPALVCAGSSGESVVAYADLRARVRSVASWLSGAGLRLGERVLVVLPNAPSFPTAICAVWGAGGVIVPMDYRSPAEQIVRIARDCTATAIVCDGLVFSRLEGRVREIPSLRIALVADPRPATYRLHIPVTPLASALSTGGPSPETEDDPGALAALVYTSGSTGRPKGVMHSHESLLASLVFTRDHLGVEPADRVLLSFPMYHLFSLRVLLVHLLAGASVVPAADILAGLKRARETRPNALILVPAACAILVRRFTGALRECAPTIRRVSIGSAAISPALLDEVQALLPDARIHIPYGMTEARIGFLEACPGRVERRIAAVDPKLDLRVQSEDGGIVERGVGEIVLRGPALMIGYWHNRDSENRAIREKGFHTRDVAEVAADGARFLAGRMDDVISVGGEKVFPNEVEAALLAHPRIRDARVVGDDDPRGVRGQVVHASVVLEQGVAFDPDEILVHCRRHLEPYKLPAVVEAVAEIARNDMGKVARIPRT